MDSNMISLMISIIALLISGFTFVLWNRERSTSGGGGSRKETESTTATRQLQLQAYERCVLLAERIALPNIISRANQSFAGSCRDMQAILLQSIKEEFEYNATQQIYVSPVAWEALKNLKEQNMLIINKVAASMPAGSTGLDLDKVIMDVLMSQEKGQLHTIVLEALNYEARKLMK